MSDKKGRIRSDPTARSDLVASYVWLWFAVIKLWDETRRSRPEFGFREPFLGLAKRLIHFRRLIYLSDEYFLPPRCAELFVQRAPNKSVVDRELLGKSVNVETVKCFSHFKYLPNINKALFPLLQRLFWFLVAACAFIFVTHEMEIFLLSSPRLLLFREARALFFLRNLYVLHRRGLIFLSL